MLGSGIAGSFDNSILSFIRNFHTGLFLLFSIVVAPIYIPTNSVGEFLFPACII